MQYVSLIENMTQGVFREISFSPLLIEHYRGRTRSIEICRNLLNALEFYIFEVIKFHEFSNSIWRIECCVIFKFIFQSFENLDSFQESHKNNRVFQIWRTC